MRIRGTLNLEILDVKDLSVNAVGAEIDTALHYALEAFNDNAGPYLVKHWSIFVEQINPITLEEGTEHSEITIEEAIERG